MTDARRRVEMMIEADPVIKKGLQRGIINTHALARYARDTEKVDTSLDAILGIIRRYPLSNEGPSDNNENFRGCELSLRNKIAELEVVYRQDNMYQIAEFAANIKTTRGEHVKLVVGPQFIRVIADQNSLEVVSKTLPPRDISRYSRNLAEITLHLQPSSNTAKATFARVATELALNDINLAGIVECAPELTLVVEEKDAPRALRALQRMLAEKAMNLAEATASTEIVPATMVPFRESEAIDVRNAEIPFPTQVTTILNGSRNSQHNRHHKL
jgi:hypothetical protein